MEKLLDWSTSHHALLSPRPFAYQLAMELPQQAQSKKAQGGGDQSPQGCLVYLKRQEPKGQLITSRSWTDEEYLFLTMSIGIWFLDCNVLKKFWQVHRKFRRLLSLSGPNAFLPSCFCTYPKNILPNVSAEISTSGFGPETSPNTWNLNDYKLVVTQRTLDVNAFEQTQRIEDSSS